MANAALTASLAYTPPGGVAPASAALSVSAPYTAESIGIMDIPASTGSGAVFAIPFGTVGEAYCLVVKNTNSKDMCLRLNASVVDEYQIPPGGEVIINHPVGATWKTVSDGVTNSNTSFTSTTAAFTAGDASKQIILVGAGPIGGDLYTTIASYVSATEVVLADATTNGTTGVTASWAAPLRAASMVTSDAQGITPGTIQYFVFGI
jgi:hypothetical protein